MIKKSATLPFLVLCADVILERESCIRGVTGWDLGIHLCSKSYCETVIFPFPFGKDSPSHLQIRLCKQTAVCI